jgi:septum formation protein
MNGFSQTLPHLPLVLASASARRRQILSHLQVPFTTFVSDVDESLPSDTDAASAVALLSCRKAWAAARDLSLQRNACRVLGADTVVCQDGVILGKPKDAAQARAMLSSYSGRSHFVYSGVTVITAQNDGVPPLALSVLPSCVHFYHDLNAKTPTIPPLDGAWTGFFALPLGGDLCAFGAVTRSCVHFRTIEEAEIEASIAAGEVFDKAGAYGIQDRASAWVEGISGDYFNIVGLPVCALDRLFSCVYAEHLSQIGKEETR